MSPGLLLVILIKLTLFPPLFRIYHIDGLANHRCDNDRLLQTSEGRVAVRLCTIRLDAIRVLDKDDCDDDGRDGEVPYWERLCKEHILLGRDVRFFCRHSQQSLTFGKRALPFKDMKEVHPR